jgi:hypothetical protein
LLKNLSLFSHKLDFPSRKKRNLKTLVFKKKKRCNFHQGQLSRELKKEARRIETTKIISRSNQ